MNSLSLSDLAKQHSIRESHDTPDSAAIAAHHSASHESTMPTLSALSQSANTTQPKRQPLLSTVTVAKSFSSSQNLPLNSQVSPAVYIPSTSPVTLPSSPSLSSLHHCSSSVSHAHKSKLLTASPFSKPTLSELASLHTASSTPLPFHFKQTISISTSVNNMSPSQLVITGGTEKAFTFSSPTPKSEPMQVSLSDLIRTHKLVSQLENHNSCTHEPVVVPPANPSISHQRNALASLAQMDKSKHAPPGFELHYSSQQGYGDTQSLSCVQYLHTNMTVPQIHSTAMLQSHHSQTTTSQIHMPKGPGRADPSLFGSTICKNFVLHKEGAVHSYMQRTHCQVMKKLRKEFYSLGTFDYSTPSPDDFIKNRQTEGFCRKYQ